MTRNALLLAVYIQLERIARHGLRVLVLDSLEQGSATAQWKMKAQFRFSFDCLISWVARGANMDTLSFNLYRSFATKGGTS